MTSTLPLLQNEAGSTWHHAEPGSGIVDEAWHQDDVVALTRLPTDRLSKGLLHTTNGAEWDPQM